MSSTGAGSSNGAGNSSVCFRSRCGRIITIPLLPPQDSQLCCSNCYGNVIELETYILSPNPPPCSGETEHQVNPALDEVEFGRTIISAFLSGGFSLLWEHVDLVDFLENHLPRIRAGDVGDTLELALKRPSPPRFARDGGYFDFEVLAKCLEEDGWSRPNCFVNPPGSSQKYINRLPSIKIGENTKSGEDDDNEKCAFCLDEFGSGDAVKQLPCSHLFHFNCISQWLETSSKCPMCRYQLCTADQVYENRQGGDPGDLISDVGVGGEVSGGESQEMVNQEPGSSSGGVVREVGAGISHDRTTDNVHWRYMIFMHLNVEAPSASASDGSSGGPRDGRTDNDREIARISSSPDQQGTQVGSADGSEVGGTPRDSEAARQSSSPDQQGTQDGSQTEEGNSH